MGKKKFWKTICLLLYSSIKGLDETLIYQPLYTDYKGHLYD